MKLFGQKPATLILWVVLVPAALDCVLKALPHTEIWPGWLAMLIFVPLAVTSNTAA